MQARIIGSCRLVDVLAEWGMHEGKGRLRERYPAELFAGEQGKLAALEVALQHRAPMIGAILAAQPLGARLVELTAESLSGLVAFDGRPASAFADDLLGQRSPEGEHARALAATDEDIRGPLLCVARLDGQVIQPPLVAYDGCHRLAAWIAQQGRRPPYPITAHLILTQRQVPYWPIRR
jgi:hypothetical protein